MRRRTFLKAAVATAAMPTILHTPSLAQQREVRIASWGGSYQDAQRESMFAPFEKETGIKVVETGGDPTFAKLRTMATAGNIEWDTAAVTNTDFFQALPLDLLEKIDYSKIDRAYLDEIDDHYHHEFGLGTTPYGLVIAYSTKAFGENRPSGWADFWDVEKFPGKRTLQAGDNPWNPAEQAVLATGVAPDKVYPMDLDLVYKSLDRIKPNVAKWTTTTAEPDQALVDGEAVMVPTMLNRIVALKEGGAPVDFTFNGMVVKHDYWVIPKGAANNENALKFIEFSSRPEIQAALSKLQPVGPVNKKAFALLSAERNAVLPTNPENLKQATFQSPGWWAETNAASGKTNADTMRDMWRRWVLK